MLRKNKWRITILELKKDNVTLYKVTKRIPEMSISETKIFKSKEEAKKQIEEWLE